MTAVGVVGAGRVGCGLALALSQAGHRVSLHGRREHPLNVRLDATWGATPPWLPAVELVFLAVPDDAVDSVAASLSDAGTLSSRHAVFHLSGVLGAEALAVLRASGASVGSFHPLQSVSDSRTAPQRLRGALVALEGDPAAVQRAEEVARSIGMRPLRLAAEQKALYHAAAVFASNYLVVVTEVARRLIERVGMSADESWTALLPLVRGTVENLAARGPGAALTGPMVRGDVSTIRKHLDALPEEDAVLYRALGRAGMRLVSLDPERERLLATLFET